MARTKQPPVRRESSSEYFNKRTASWEMSANGAESTKLANGQSSPPAAVAPSRAQASPPTPAAAVVIATRSEAGVLQLIISVAGIYASFLTWAYLQEKLTTTPYGPSGEKWHFPVFLNTIQSVFAATVGCVYLLLSTPRGAALPPVIPSRRILGPLALVAVTSSLASPFGYASLAHIDYITFLLAKSCKLLPVMFLHITLFRKRYPLYKYLVVAAVTAGVAVFTLHSGRKHKASSAAKSDDSNVAWGLLLLGINLLFDGLTNSTQDYIFQTFRPYSGPQMMCANNMMSTLVTGLYLLASPYLVSTGLGDWFGMDVAGSAGELGAALDFMRRYPSVWKDVLGFAACGAVGQVFIFYTLSTFSSVLLVTVTVTRKMFTMILSVVAFGHRLTHMQWLGVGLVFGGIGVEAGIARQEKIAKEAAAAKAKANAAKKDS
ncbi:hypothetical protein Purlil1_2982 [Purpureocillium lilacinum]|uniref:UDP-galactose transporter homolog 1 n=1 Tax=Purpureocillium lilacinum TaxID=33203 RepID=A0ABR0C8G4_PURLI|nr:hypothetical protein Purlil1_2982 [Purpureocillium lilacinum]